VHLVDDLVDGPPLGVAARRVIATRDRPVEAQPGQMRACQSVDGVRDRVISACDVEERTDVDVRGLNFSHAGL
jgi:hypothetical protein